MASPILVRLPWSSPSVRMMIALRPVSRLNFSLAARLIASYKSVPFGSPWVGTVPPPAPGMPNPPLPPAVLISALLIACDNSRGLSVKSCSRSTFTSNETRKASSFCRSTRWRNWLPASCSRGKTFCWLPEVSSRIPRVNGWLVSATKLFSVCGDLSSVTVQSFFVKCGTSSPFLSLTVKNRSTRFTFTFKVATAVSSATGAGALLTGDSSGDGAS